MAENIGSLFPTKIPTYEESADIKEAIRLYHYGAPSGTGSGEYNPNNQTLSNVVRNSIAGQFKFIDEEIADIRLEGHASTYGSSAPVAMPNGDDLVNGFVWMNSSSTASTLNGAIAVYQNTAPVAGIANGTLWVDKDSSPLKMYVYDAAEEEWKEIGA